MNKILFLGLAMISLAAAYQELTVNKMRFEWDGFWTDLNYRDVGQSLNECLGKAQFKSGLLLRANRFYSGHSCNKIGNPQKIYSLNYDPQKDRYYYCVNQSNHGDVTGIVFDKSINLPEFDDVHILMRPQVRQAVCSYFLSVIDDLAHKRCVLIHCDAGRDRTGSFMAILVWSLAQSMSKANPDLLEAIECDYRKTQSLDSQKFGRMKKLITELEIKHLANHNLLTSLCAIPEHFVKKAATSLMH